ncbi:hypothetical protein RN001_008517 [Aquatica leii]|uniref:C3H1-type domain-containing protein n=1 Tax=Aquatica leii TaxID=1421715 RepID=A0AAN7PFS0_9COLE|nr:hypothetical protein RN001_008517 [Aquatica leii]
MVRKVSLEFQPRMRMLKLTVHKEWRKLAKKARRKRIRQKIAQQLHEEKETELLKREQSPRYNAWLEEQIKLEEFEKQEQARIAAEQEAQWLKNEKEAQCQWVILQAKLALAREERAKQVMRIKEEWENEQKKLKELKEKKEKELEEKQKHQEELQERINHFIEHGGDVPTDLIANFETNPTKAVCPFFQKTGACRFKDTCSRNHIRPGISRVLLIPGFYSHYSLQETESEHGTDAGLEFENYETYDHFKDFFYDVLPEMEKWGYIRQFKVCCNHEVHLRGNVYVEYSHLREAVRSYQKFHSRWYGGKQLHVEFCNIQSWKSAICGLFARQKCPKGSSCNFLHVFPNPNNMFTCADKDLHRTPPENIEESMESDAKHWRWSESPEPIRYCDSERRNRHQSRRKKEHRKRSRRRSKSKERHKSREHKYSGKSRKTSVKYD